MLTISKSWTLLAALAGASLGATALMPAGAAAQTTDPDTPGISTPTEVPANQTPPPTSAPTETPVTPPREPVEVVTNEGEQPLKQRLHIGPEVGVFLPSSSSTRDRFGNTWYSIGVGLGSVRQTQAVNRPMAEIYLMAHSHSGAKAYLLPIDISYRRALGRLIPPESKAPQPYVGGSLGLILSYLKYNSGTAGDPANISGKVRAGGNASVLAGSTFGDNLYLEARYMLTTKMAGYDFNGLNVTLGLRF